MYALIQGELDYHISRDLTAEYHLTPDNPMYGVRAHALVPLRVRGSVVGVIFVDNLIQGEVITQEDIAGLLPFADQAAVAIQNARLFEDLNQAQQALVRSEKLRAVGELASGVAHNVNNVLAAVLGYAELIEAADEATAEIKQYARTIERSALDGAEIVRRMQYFASKESGIRKTVLDLSTLAQEAVDLTRPFWHNQAAARGAKIEVVLGLSKPLWTVGVASELREVIVNVIRNAADAMPEGGTLTVRTCADEDRAVVEVMDTGVGMEAAVLRRVFEPFFTTKGSGLGTGLGLSVAWGIIERHGGYIAVQSAPGAGAAFRILLPLSEPPGSEPTPDLQTASLAGARLLLVEDEEIVLGGLARTLEAAGAVIALAENAAEALEWLETHAAQCHLIVSDHGMIGLTGLELLAEVEKRYPHIRRVLLSGWGDHLPGQTDRRAAERVLTKPIPQQTLVAALAGLLSEPPPHSD